MSTSNVTQPHSIHKQHILEHSDTPALHALCYLSASSGTFDHHCIKLARNTPSFATKKLIEEFNSPKRSQNDHENKPECIQQYTLQRGGRK